MKESTFNAYLGRIKIKNKSSVSGCSQDIEVVLNDIKISDHDLTVLKQINPDARVIAKIRPEREQLSIDDVEEERKRNQEEEYKIL